MDIFKNKSQVIASTQVLGNATVEMLFQVHQDALWMLENMGVGCLQPEIVDVFCRFEADGKAIAYENRIFITGDLVEECLALMPGADEFFVPRNSLFIGGRASYVYDDSMGRGGSCLSGTIWNELPGLQRPIPLWPAWDLASS